MKYLYLVISCLGIFVAGFLVSGLHGIYWFLAKSTLSSAAVLACMTFKTKISLAISILESIFVLVTFFAAVGYLTDYLVYYYVHYITFLTVACIIEAILLIYGIPYGKLYRSISQFYGARINRYPSSSVSHFRHFKDLS